MQEKLQQKSQVVLQRDREIGSKRGWSQVVKAKLQKYRDLQKISRYGGLTVYSDEQTLSSPPFKQSSSWPGQDQSLRADHPPTDQKLGELKTKTDYIAQQDQQKRDIMVFETSKLPKVVL